MIYTYPIPNHKKEDGKIEVVVRIFYDDLQMAMGLQPGQPLPVKYLVQML